MRNWFKLYLYLYFLGEEMKPIQKKKKYFSISLAVSEKQFLCFFQQNIEKKNIQSMCWNQRRRI